MQVRGFSLVEETLSSARAILQVPHRKSTRQVSYEGLRNGQ